MNEILSYRKPVFLICVVSGVLTGALFGTDPASIDLQACADPQAATLSIGTGEEIIIPAGSQLEKKLDSYQAHIHIESEPQIGISPDEWPVMEFGSNAIVFANAEGKGRIYFVSFDSVPTEIGEGFNLDSVQKCTSPINLDIDIDQRGVAITALSQVRSFGFVQPVPVENRIILTSPASLPWPISIHVTSRTQVSDDDVPMTLKAASLQKELSRDAGNLEVPVSSNSPTPSAASSVLDPTNPLSTMKPKSATEIAAGPSLELYVQSSVRTVGPEFARNVVSKILSPEAKQ